MGNMEPGLYCPKMGLADLRGDERLPVCLEHLADNDSVPNSTCVSPASRSSSKYPSGGLVGAKKAPHGMESPARINAFATAMLWA